MPSSPTSRGFLWAVGAAVAFFLLAPLAAILPLSFNASPYFTYPMEGLSLRWYEVFFGSGDWRRALANSLLVGTASSALATVLGTAAALGLSDPRVPARSFLTALLISPMIVPVVITAIAVYFFYAGFGLNDTYAGVILAHALLGAPFVLITVNATLAGFDRALLRAAASLGASPWRAFRQVTLPLIGPGVAAGAILAFATSFDEVVVVLFVAGVEQRTLPRPMWAGVNQELSPTIAAAAAVIIVISMAMMASVAWLRGRVAAPEARAA
jgi:putative spermidine/putrescine transport system permease protein